MHPEGIQVQTGGDMGPIEHFPLSGPQSWAVNPGKPQDDDFSGIEGHEARLVGLALAQKRVLEKKKGMEEFGGEEFTPTDQKFLDKLIEMDKEETVYSKPILTAAQGGRINRYMGGGFEGLGSMQRQDVTPPGMELDLRVGGFIPIGAQEKADDVKARVSKNEFVFTADAVKAAGGGSVNEGAKRMYDTMKRLESQVG